MTNDTKRVWQFGRYGVRYFEDGTLHSMTSQEANALEACAEDVDALLYEFEGSRPTVATKAARTHLAALKEARGGS